MKRCSTAVSRLLIAGALMVTVGYAAAQQAYPSKPIHFVVPYPPGGTTDPLSRLLGQKLAESVGQPVLVENRAGGNTIIGVDALVKSAPDGHTIGFVASSLVLVPLLVPAPYDPLKDVAPIATFSRSEYVLLISPTVPANNLKELIAHAKSKTAQLNYATAGAGGPQHLAHELLNLLAAIKTQHIPYKGGGPAMTGLLGGQVQMYFCTIVTGVPYVKSGKLRAVATSGNTRTPALSQVPTFGEAGLSGLEDIAIWYGVGAPAGTPKYIISRLTSEIAKILETPDFKEKLAGQGLEPYYSTPEQFARLMKADLARNIRIIKAANIKFEN